VIHSFTCRLYVFLDMYSDVASKLFLQLPSTYEFTTVNYCDGIDAKAVLIHLTSSVKR
jgi:hypothetical protein